MSRHYRESYNKDYSKLFDSSQDQDNQDYSGSTSGGSQDNDTRSNWYQQSNLELSRQHSSNNSSNQASYNFRREQDFVNQGYDILDSFPTPPPIQPIQSYYRPINVQQPGHQPLYHINPGGSDQLTYFHRRPSNKRPFESPATESRDAKMPRRRQTQQNQQQQSSNNRNPNLINCGEPSGSRSNSSQRQQNQQNPSKNKKSFANNSNVDHEWPRALAYVMMQLKKRAENKTEDAFTDELHLMTQCLQISPNQSKEQKDEVDSDLAALLNPLGVKNIFPFGSKLTGLEFLQSDIDYYVELENKPEIEIVKTTIINQVAKYTRNYYGAGQRSPFYVKCLILGARVPLIRLVHRQTNIVCDVNFTSENGYYNSRYIKLVLSFDKRIKDMAIILKLWSKINHLNEKMVMSNYCLVNLLFFYLQNISTPMLGSLRDARQSGRDTSPSGKWSFYYDASINKCSVNSQTTRELIEGFFDYYSNLKYDDYVICLYTGNLIKRGEFETSEDLSYYRLIVEQHTEEEMKPFKVEDLQSIVVQDPFEQNINIGIKGNTRIQSFTECIKDAHKKCTNLKDYNFARLLFNIFTESPIVASPAKTPKPVVQQQKLDKKLFAFTINPTQGDLKLCQDILIQQQAEDAKPLIDEDSTMFFYEHLVETMSKLFTEIFLCEVIPGESKVDGSFLSRVFNVKLQYDTFKDRKKFDFKNELTYSAEIGKSRTIEKQKNPVNLDMLVTIFTKNSGRIVDCKMVNREYNPKSLVMQFGNYVSVNISAAMRFYLKQKWDSRTCEN